MDLAHMVGVPIRRTRSVKAVVEESQELRDDRQQNGRKWRNRDQDIEENDARSAESVTAGRKNRRQTVASSFQTPVEKRVRTEVSSDAVRGKKKEAVVVNLQKFQWKGWSTHLDQVTAVKIVEEVHELIHDVCAVLSMHLSFLHYRSC
ncbi:hypothetical protein FRX31_017558 [Thalictrum thalictroides]|uniref:Uncharacterized protein n=1 Tax=Thalictrum thalictroides TaxID=46969 RepID=A0A7J6W7G7_THATH|nr:hypothetical protein FRX31_017558 [Thalictrum thalictroides]